MMASFCTPEGKADKRLKNVAGNFASQTDEELSLSNGESHGGPGLQALFRRSREGESLNEDNAGKRMARQSKGNNSNQHVLEKAPLLDENDKVHVMATYGSVDIPRNDRIPEDKKWCEPNAERVVNWFIDVLGTRSSSVMAFLVVLVTGIVLSAAANLNLDNSGYQVEPTHVKGYVVLLMVVCVLWVCVCILPQKFVGSGAHHSSLIPSHLLTGVAIFGCVNAISQMLYFVDFIKCSRHVPKVNAMYGIYPCCKAFFIYLQIYLFYRLSRGGIRNCKIQGGNFFIMFTLATNMVTWFTTFIGDASADNKMRDITWLNHYYFGVNGYDACANASDTSPQVARMHNMVSSLRPFIVTFSLEYALLSSGMLFHVWLSIKEKDLTLHDLDKKYWSIWRVGFIIGLLSLPTVVVAYIHQRNVRDVGSAKMVLMILQVLICATLVTAGVYCMYAVKKFFTKTDKNTKLDVILLGFSFVGFFILDICNCMAAAAELGNLGTARVVWFGLTSFAELVAAGVQFLFIMVAYNYRIPDNPDDATHGAGKNIRQFASFAFVNNIAYWGAKTYELRSSEANVSEIYFGSYAWFCLSHLAYPLCIFFYFHLAICYANVVSFYSQFDRPLNKVN